MGEKQFRSGRSVADKLTGKKWRVTAPANAEGVETGALDHT